MYHCHLLWHEDQGMMGQFAVVEPGSVCHDDWRNRTMSTDTTDHRRRTATWPRRAASIRAAEPTATDAAPPRRGYGALWAKVPREFGFLILTMPIAIIGLVVLATVFFTGLGLVDDLHRHLPR